MTQTVATLNFILGTAGVVMLVIAVAFFIDILFFKRRHFGPFIDSWGLLVAAILLISASIMSLVYSEIFGFVPCGLCWMMRIFVFSQAFIITTAAFIKDKGVVLYGIVLAVPGILLGLYQHYLQLGGGNFLPCPSAGGDCAKRILFEYGFMTFPLMGTSMLLLVFAIYIYIYQARKTT